MPGRRIRAREEEWAVMVERMWEAGMQGEDGSGGDRRIMESEGE